MPAWWRRTLGRELTRLRRDARPALLWSVRITAAAVAAYVVALLIFPGTQPLLAPLTAMLVVQVTPVSLLARGIDRVVAVVAGVLLAVAFASVVPLHWWSLGVLIVVALTVGHVLRLRSNQIEVAISGMLVLGVGTLGAESAAWQRFTETLVGAAVGVLANLVFPPKVASLDAGRAIDGLADSVSELLSRSADALVEVADGERELAPAARGWLGQARQITHDIPQVGAALLHAEQGRRLNVRAVGTPDVGPGLRQGLEALEHSAVAIRVMYRALVDATGTTGDVAWTGEDGARDVLLGLAQTFRELAAGVDAFGQLVRDDADPGTTMRAADAQTLRDALDGLHEARARLDDLLTSDTAPELLELHREVLATVKRLLAEMDLGERIRRQVRLVRPPRPRPGFSAASRRRRRGGPTEPTPEAETQVLPKLPSRRRPRR
ncbi:MAG TPA: FUSC family protein [Nocardioidaceae bacterium]|nr:FUSC family protein [Nocardioidaceae bacterium]